MATPKTGKRWVLAARPVGAPKATDFALKEFEIPTLQQGEVLTRILFHTVAPGIRPKLTSQTYVPMLAIGEGIPGLGVGVVEASRDDSIAVGDPVSGELGWASHAITKAGALYKLDPAIFGDDIPYSAAVDVLGAPGLTAYFGLLRVGALQSADTVLVSSAGGAVGSIVGQIATIKGGDAVGIAGSADKCEALKDFGFRDSINYNAEPNLAEAIKRRHLNGVNVFFDNVGGKTLDAAIGNMRQFGRVVICGQSSEYNKAEAHGIRRVSEIIFNRLRIQGFVMYDYLKDFDRARADLASWVREGKVLHRPTLVRGIEKAAETFVARFEGGVSLSRPLIALG